MGRYRTLASIGAAMFAGFMTIHAQAESPPETQPTVAVTGTTDAVPAQVVSTALPADAKNCLFSHTSYPEAWTAAQKSNRPILLYVTMPGCPHCEKMMEETYHFPVVEQMVSESFESLRVSRQTHAKLVKSLNVKWYPTTVLVGANNKIVDVIEGYVDAKDFQQRLKMGIASTDSSTQTR